AIVRRCWSGVASQVDIASFESSKDLQRPSKASKDLQRSPKVSKTYRISKTYKAYKISTASETSKTYKTARSPQDLKDLRDLQRPPQTTLLLLSIFISNRYMTQAHTKLWPKS